MTTFRANAPVIDLAALERDLARIPSVGSAKVVLDDAEQVQEIHVVCGSDRPPSTVSRDVQSVIAARWGLDVDQRCLSIVQLDGPIGATAADHAVEKKEIRIVGTSVSVTAELAEATATLALGNQQATGSATGGSSWDDQRRLVAAATMDALVGLDGRMRSFVVHDVTIADAGAFEVVVSVLNDERGESFAGAAPVGDDGELRAAADSVLRAFPPPRR
jgi:hypothetical protein